MRARMLPDGGATGRRLSGEEWDCHPSSFRDSGTAADDLLASVEGALSLAGALRAEETFRERHWRQLTAVCGCHALDLDNLSLGSVLAPSPLHLAAFRVLPISIILPSAPSLSIITIPPQLSNPSLPPSSQALQLDQHAGATATSRPFLSPSPAMHSRRTVLQPPAAPARRLCLHPHGTAMPTKRSHHA